MNCYFCQQPMFGKVIETANSYVATWSVYHCPPCAARYEYSHEMDDVVEYSFLYKDLSVDFYPGDRSPKFAVYSRPTLDSFYKEIFSLDFIPDLTPSNFSKRYKTLLTFL
jgi:hypothetical protein